MKTIYLFISFVLSLIAIFFMPSSVFAQTVGNGIGVRILPNADRLSPQAWYQQNVPNPGNPVSLTVDGYPAVQDGRSVYVAAINQVGGSLFPNIYLISHNDTSDPIVREVFNEFIKQLRLNSNIEDAFIRGQLRRDMKRAADLSDIKISLDAYQAKFNTYPTFEAGSFIPNSSYSVWPSWQNTLGNILGSALPVDPINQFNGCPDTHDQTTCWSSEEFSFACPVEAYGYGYQAIDNGGGYVLFTNYEYNGPGNWQEQSFTSSVGGSCFNFVTSDTSDADNDGIPSAIDNCPLKKNENQEDTDSDGIGNICDICPNDATNDQDNDGVCGNIDNCPTIGNSNQTDLDLDGIGDVCDFQTCGNNIQEGSEACDGRSGLDNEFQVCSSDCGGFSQQSFCGDGVVQNPNSDGQIEFCDGGSESIACDELINGYKTAQTRACNAICEFGDFSQCQPIESCGDGIINGLEQCDRGDQNGVQCQAEFGETCTYCDATCEIETAQGANCGDGFVDFSQGEQCDDGINNGRRCTPVYGKSCDFCSNSCEVQTLSGPVCGDGNRDIPFEQCDGNTELVPCEPGPTYLYKERNCQFNPDDENDPRNCTLGDFGECFAIGSCGDGVINGPETCDDALTPGICQDCSIAQITKPLEYEIAQQGIAKICLGPNAGVGGLTCGAPDSVTMDGVITGSGWQNVLGVTMNVHNIFWYDGFCEQEKKVILKKDGQEVSKTVYAMQVGQNCQGGDNDYNLFVYQQPAPFTWHRVHTGTQPDTTTQITNGIDADEIIMTNGGFFNGGYAEGKVKLTNAQSLQISTQAGIVVIDRLADRRINAQSIPDDTYSLTYNKSDGVLMWFGRTASSTSGSQTTNRRTDYILACVDANSNDQCDYLDIASL